MRCITVCEPFASALIYGGKDPENRKRALPIVGVTLIHAGKSTDWMTGPLCQWVHERWTLCPSSPLMALYKFRPRMGMVIGAVDFGSAYEFEQQDPGAVRRTPWETGPACHPVVDRVAFAKPFPVRGMQGAFTVPAANIPILAMAEIEELAERVRRRTGA